MYELLQICVHTLSCCNKIFICQLNSSSCFPSCPEICVALNKVDCPGSILFIEATQAAFRLLYQYRAAAVDIFHRHQKIFTDIKKLLDRKEKKRNYTPIIYTYSQTTKPSVGVSERTAAVQQRPCVPL